MNQSTSLNPINAVRPVTLVQSQEPGNGFESCRTLVCCKKLLVPESFWACLGMHWPVSRKKTRQWRWPTALGQIAMPEIGVTVHRPSHCGGLGVNTCDIMSTPAPQKKKENDVTPGLTPKPCRSNSWRSHSETDSAQGEREFRTSSICDIICV